MADINVTPTWEHEREEFKLRRDAYRRHCSGFKREAYQRALSKAVPPSPRRRRTPELGSSDDMHGAARSAVRTRLARGALEVDADMPCASGGSRAAKATWRRPRKTGASFSPKSASPEILPSWPEDIGLAEVDTCDEFFSASEADADSLPGCEDTVASTEISQCASDVEDNTVPSESSPRHAYGSEAQDSFVPSESSPRHACESEAEEHVETLQGSAELAVGTSEASEDLSEASSDAVDAPEQQDLRRLTTASDAAASVTEEFVGPHEIRLDDFSLIPCTPEFQALDGPWQTLPGVWDMLTDNALPEPQLCAVDEDRPMETPPEAPAAQVPGSGIFTMMGMAMPIMWSVPVAPGFAAPCAPTHPMDGYGNFVPASPAISQPAVSQTQANAAQSSAVEQNEVPETAVVLPDAPSASSAIGTPSAPASAGAAPAKEGGRKKGRRSEAGKKRQLERWQQRRLARKAMLSEATAKEAAEREEDQADGANSTAELESEPGNVKDFAETPAISSELALIAMDGARTEAQHLSGSTDASPSEAVRATARNGSRSEAPRSSAFKQRNPRFSQRRWADMSEDGWVPGQPERSADWFSAPREAVPREAPAPRVENARASQHERRTDLFPAFEEGIRPAQGERFRRAQGRNDKAAVASDSYWGEYWVPSRTWASHREGGQPREIRSDWPSYGASTGHQGAFPHRQGAEERGRASGEVFQQRGRKWQGRTW